MLPFARRPQTTRPTRSPRDLTIAFPLEDITRDGKTFTVPKKDSVHVNDPPDVKRRFFEQTLTAIRNGTGKYSVKVHAFCSRFTIGTAKLNEAQNRLTKLHNYNTDIIQLTDPDVFAFSDTRLHLESGARMEYNPATATDANFTNALRNTARFYGAILRIRPNQAHESCTTAAMEVQIAFRLPLTNGAVSPTVTHQLLRNPRTLLQLIDETSPAEIGILSRTNGHLAASNDITSFETQFKEHYHHCLFDVVSTLIKNTFVGAQPVGDAHIALDRCRQFHFDPITRQMSLRTVQQYYDMFINTLMGLPTDQP